MKFIKSMFFNSTLKFSFWILNSTRIKYINHISYISIKYILVIGCVLSNINFIIFFIYCYIYYILHKLFPISLLINNYVHSD